MTITKYINGNTGELHLEGKLLFLSGADFHKNLREVFESKIDTLAIYIDNLTFMDSAGLGMLMVAYKECHQRDIPLIIYHPKGDVKTLLKMTKSYERFNIVD